MFGPDACSTRLFTPVSRTSSLNVTTSNANKPRRIAVLNSHPIQYFAPLYAYLNSAPDLEVTALYLSDASIRGGKDRDFGREVKWDLDLLSGYPSVFLGEAARRRDPAGFGRSLHPRSGTRCAPVVMTRCGSMGTITRLILSGSRRPRISDCLS